MLDGLLGGVFDIGESKFRIEPGSPVALAQPFQITSFSFVSRSQTITRADGMQMTFMMPMALTFGNALRPAEVWAGLGAQHAYAKVERAQRLADKDLSSLWFPRKSTFRASTALKFKVG